MTRARLISLAVGTAVVGLTAAALWPRGSGQAEAERDVRTAQVRPADFYITTRVTGYLDAVNVHPIVCEVGGGGGGRGFGGGGTRIVWKLDDGSHVKEGDVVMRLDAASLEQNVTDLEAQLADAQENVATKEADGQKSVQNARAGLTKAEEALQLAQTQNAADLEAAAAEVAYQEKELEVARGELEKRQRLLAEKLMSRTELEAAEDEVRQRELSLEQARRALNRTQHDVAVTEALRKMDVQKAQIQLQRAEADLVQGVSDAKRNLEGIRVQLEDARAQLEATQVKAPAEGLLLFERNWQGEPLRVGDEVNEGERVASVIDPADMWVRADIGEMEIEQVKVGQEASVIIAALGGAKLPGKVEAIDNLARERTWWEGGVAGKKVFGALIRLTKRDDRLRPGMGATVEIRLRHVNQGLAVPVQAVFTVAGGKHVVYVRESELYRGVPVEVGERSEELAVVKGNLKAGDVVACEQPPPRLMAEGGGHR